MPPHRASRDRDAASRRGPGTRKSALLRSSSVLSVLRCDPNSVPSYSPGRHDHAIPSYDDLTPSSRHHSARNVLAGDRFLPSGRPAPASHRRRRDRGIAPLLRVFARRSLLFRSEDSTSSFMIARDFSPRVERHGGSSVVRTGVWGDCSAIRRRSASARSGGRRIRGPPADRDCADADGRAAPAPLCPGLSVAPVRSPPHFPAAHRGARAFMTTTTRRFAAGKPPHA